MASKTPFISADNVHTAYEESRKWMRPYFDPLDELERIARNLPSPKIPQGLPKITDGTTAAIVQETPKRVIQQTPTGIFECKDYPEYAKIADIITRDIQIPMAIKNGSYLQKTWNMLGKSMTYGRSTSYTYYTERNGIFYTDFVIPYVKDIITEKGKVYGPDCNIRFMRSWYQRRDLKAIIDFEKAREQKDDKYKSDWNLVKLAEFMESGSTAKPSDLQTPAEKEKGDGDTGGYEVIHAFQTGKKSAFYSFAPNFNKGLPLRTKTNNDPRGAMPLDDLYCNIDLSNPLGRGVVELSGGIQNLMDQEMQLFQFMMALIAAPPIQKWGSVNTNSLKLMPNAIWDMGTAPNNRVEPYRPMAEPITSFVSNFQFLQSKIQALNNSADTSVGSTNGNFGQSKTQAGVKSQMERLGVGDNYLRRQTEEWFSSQIETGTNIYFAERKGSTELTLDKNDLKEFEKTPAQKFVKGNKLTIPYSKINDVVFHFSYNPDSSEVKENTDNIEKLSLVLDKASRIPNQEVQDKIPGLFKLIVKEIGAEGTDDLFPEDQTDEQGNPVEKAPQINPQAIQQIVQPMIEQSMQQAIQQATEALKAQSKQPDTPEERLIKSMGLKFNDLPEESKQKVLADLGLESTQQTPFDRKLDLETLTALGNAEPEPQPNPILEDPLSPAEENLAVELTNRGYNENDIEQAVVMLRQQRQPDEIMQVLGAKR